MIKLVKVNKYFNRLKINQMHIIINTSFELAENGIVATVFVLNLKVYSFSSLIP